MMSFLTYITGFFMNFELLLMGPSKDHSTKVWLQLAQWFLRRRFLCEFPIGFHVHLGPRAELPDTFLEENHPRDEIFKKSSPLKLLSQSQSNFAEMILG
jgi:hypothetical protein